ncbi:MAG: dihydroorotase [Defluviitaleaceae bacterium]|nr:dihydroorotase [Defluviitaleaceae bacterium]
MGILIKNGRVIDPANGVDKIADVLIESGKIAAFGQFDADGHNIIDAADMWVVPGFIDLHVHFREPGQTHKEDIATGSAAAALGGFTTVCTMPNTNPAVDSPDGVDFQIRRGREIGLVDILPVGAITQGLAGKELAPIAELIAAGAVGISDDGYTVQNADLKRQAMEIAAKLGTAVFSHCEEEDEMIARDIKLAEETGVRLHICHVSTAVGVGLIRDAKARGVAVTAEAAPHHFSLCNEDFDGQDTNFKMNPPLRGRKDMKAVLAGLADGTIDAIATDHAPHSADEKAVVFADAPNGVVGLETALAVAFTHLVKTGLMTPTGLVEKMAVLPAKILGINKGHLTVGAPADVTIIDPTANYSINPANFGGKSKNTPFAGQNVQGRVVHTIFGGKIVVKDGKLVD